MLALLHSLLLTADNGLAKTPPMGWNPYNHFSGSYNESIVREHAHLFVSLGLDKLGYQYVNLDAKWGTTARSKDCKKMSLQIST